MSKHKHAWKRSAHLDHCHSFTNIYICKRCGASVQTTTERSFKEDPMSLIWMEPIYREITRDERGRFCKRRVEEVVCNRCAELKAGATPTHAVTIVDKDGNVEHQSVEEIEQ